MKKTTNNELFNNYILVQPMEMGVYGIIGVIIYKVDNFDCYVDPNPAFDFTGIDFTNIDIVKKIKHSLECNPYPEKCITSYEQSTYAKYLFEIFARPIISDYYNKP